jgi:hypothetical protein
MVLGQPGAFVSLVADALAFRRFASDRFYPPAEILHRLRPSAVEAMLRVYAPHNGAQSNSSCHLRRCRQVRTEATG